MHRTVAFTAVILSALTACATKPSAASRATSSATAEPSASTPPAASAPPPAIALIAASTPPAARIITFHGTITDMDFGCWADKTCAIKVDAVWIVVAGGGPSAEPRAPRGKLVGITMSGDGAPALLAKFVGRRAEVRADPLPSYGPDGTITGYDPRRLTLEGNASFHVKLSE